MDLIQIAITALVTSSMGALVGAIVAMVSNRKSKHDEKSEQDKRHDELIEEGMRVLMWRELKEIHSQASDNGGMSISDRKHLEGVYGVYHGLGGNGTGTRLFEEAMELPVID